MVPVAFIGPRTIPNTVCGTGNSRLDSTIDVEDYRPVGNRLVSKTCQRTLEARLEKCIHIVVGTTNINTLRPEMRLKSSPDEIICSHSPNEERHLELWFHFMIMIQSQTCNSR